MANKKQKLKKKKDRERRVKKQLLSKRTLLREERSLEREIERIQWENRDKTPPPLISRDEDE